MKRMRNDGHQDRSMGRGLATTMLLMGMTIGPALAAEGPNASDAPIQVETLTVGLEHPWAVAFLPQGRFLITERPGRLRVVDAAGRLQPPVQGLPEIDARGQGGLLDVVLDSDFRTHRTIYFCFTEPGRGGNSTAMARATLSDDETRLDDVRVIFSQRPKVQSQLHFGCRIVQRQVEGKPDGTLFLTLGERFSRRNLAQKLDNHLGKIVRVGKDGSIPDDNPFVDRGDALPEIWSYGHRNIQGATLAPEGTFWTHEHGPMGGDEINLPEPGGNHGWPLVSFGRNYDGTPVGDGSSSKPGLNPPLYQWTPSIAPSGMAFLTSDRYGKHWQGNLFVGALKFQHLERIELQNGKVVRRHKLLQDLAERIRDVRQGPDGLLYVLTDHSEGRLLRLLPRD